jgi:O-antigen ligase
VSADLRHREVRLPASRVEGRGQRVLLWLLACRTLLPDAIQYVLAGRPAVASTHQSLALGRVQLASLTAQLLDLALLCCSAGVLLGLLAGRTRNSRPHPVLLCLLLVLIQRTAVSWYMGQPPSLTRVTLAAVLLALWASPPPSATALRVGAQLTVIIAATSLLVGFVAPSVGVMRSNDVRLLLLHDGRLSGLLSHANALGMALAFGLPFVVWYFKGKRRSWVGGLVLLALLATASRTAVVSAIAVVALVALWTSPTGRARAVATWTVASSQTVALTLSLLPLLGRIPPGFQDDGRVGLWQLVEASWRERPLWGFGSGVWDQLARSSTDRFPDFAFHAHNLWLDVVFTSGLVGVFLTLGLVLRWWLGALREIGHGDSAAAMTLLTFLIFSVSEVPLNTAFPNVGLVMVILALLICDAHVNSETAHAGLPYSADHDRKRMA